MLIPLQPPETWDLLNDRLRHFLGYRVENPVKVYPNLYSSVEEICCQLGSFLAHKKAFTWMKGLSPTFEAAVSGFLREGYQVQGVDWKVLSQFSGQETQWVEALPKDTLFVLIYEDHAVTGQALALDQLDEALNQKKIYSIRVSHFGLPSSDAVIRPYTVFIGPTGFGSLSAAVCGARFRAPERGVPYLPWTLPTLKDRVLYREEKSVVEAVESEFSEFKWFQGSVLRRFDRVVLCFPEFTGDRVLHLISKHMNVNLSEHQAQTPHLCRWNSVKAYKSWWTPNPSPEQLRGMVVFSVDVAQRSDFIPSLKQSLEDLKNDLLWR